jgi:hypothetical protein
MTDLAPYYSVFRSVAIYGSGVATAFGFMSAGESGDITAGVDHIIAGTKEIVVGVGMIAPIVMTAWGVLTHTKSAILARVAEMPGPDKLVAFMGIPDSAKLRAVEAMPDVKAIVPVTGARGAVAAAVADPERPKVIDASPAPPSSPSKPLSSNVMSSIPGDGRGLPDRLGE